MPDDEGAEGDAAFERRWPFLVALGAPAFGTTFAITTISTYLPTLLGAESGPLVTGAVISGEGAAGLALPLLTGLANDRWSRRVAGPLAIGAAVTLAAPLFPASRGYDAMWFVIALAVLAAVPLLLWPRSRVDRRRDAHPDA